LSSLVTKGLSVSGKFSFDNYNEAWTNRPIQYGIKQYEGIDPLTGEDQYQIIGDQGVMRSEVASAANRAINIDLGINYMRSFGKHNVGGMFVFNRREFTNMLAGNELDNIPNRWQGFAGRASYNYGDRYFVEFNFGYNGSENFPKGSRYGFFPSASAGYSISNEEFWDHNFFVSNLKFRGSYGIVGNDRIQGTRFAYLTTINKGARGYLWGASAIWDGGYAEAKIGAENVTWEMARKTNIGLDLGLYKNTISLTVDVFQELRSNIFLQRQSVSSFAGYNSESIPWGNLGKASNKGIDLKLEIKNRTSSGFYYSFQGNFTFARSKVLENDMPPQAYKYLDAAGHPIGQLWGLEALGLFESMEDVDNSAKQTFIVYADGRGAHPGDIKYKDQNGDGIIDDYDRVPVGFSNIPEIMYGFGGTVSYKGIDLTFLFNGVANRSIFIDGFGMMPYNLEFPGGNVFREYYDNRYIPGAADNSAALFPAVIAATNANNYRTSTMYQRDAKYLRLENVEIGYTLPTHLTAKAAISRVRFFISGVNLFVIDGIKFIDPEMEITGTYPRQRVFNGGIQIDF
jgi:TonB-linked SusC/RagA family outer membrane protein